MSFYCNACGQNPCTGECAEPCEHGIAKREFCDDCFITSSDDQAQKPDDWTHAKAQMDHEMGVKPDASPREWTLLFKGDGYFEPHVLGAEPSDFPKAGKRTFDVIEKSAYDALARKVEELESRSWICYTCGDGLKPLKKLMEIENLNKELADAEAEIERLQHVINYDMPHPQLTQAQQRIKELEAQADAKEEYCGLQRRVQAEIKEREAKLVAALQTLCNEVKGTLSAHEIAIRYDSGNSNWTCLEVALATAEAALKANKGGA